MVIYGEDRYDCPGARPGEPRASRAGRPGPRAEFEPRCPRCGCDLVPGLVAEDALLDRAAPVPRPRPRRTTWVRRGPGTTAPRRGRSATTTSMGRGCCATPVPGIASIFRVGAAAQPRAPVFEGEVQRRAFPRHRTSPARRGGETCAPTRGARRRPGGALRCGRLNRAALCTARSRQRPRCRERSRSGRTRCGRHRCV